MSEPLSESLSKFTPSAGRLERDALLFAAGQNSARPNRVWQGMTVALAATQLVTLVCIWPLPTSWGPGAPEAMARRSVPVQPVESVQPVKHVETRLQDSDRQDIWSAGRVPDELMLEQCSAKGVVQISSEPELRAFGLPPDSMLN